MDPGLMQQLASEVTISVGIVIADVHRLAATEAMRAGGGGFRAPSAAEHGHVSSSFLR
jgi:hypothetical protein